MELLKLTKAECPTCGAFLRIFTEWRGGEVGTFSLTGVQMKFMVRQAPILKCSTCGFKRHGEFEYDASEVIGCVFPREE